MIFTIRRQNEFISARGEYVVCATLMSKYLVTPETPLNEVEILPSTSLANLVKYLLITDS